MRLFPLSLATACCLCAASPAMADSLAEARALYEDNCLMCHDTTVHSRADHRIQNMDSLIKQVDMCQGDVGEEWSAEQIRAVATYLGNTFYKFDLPSQAAGD